MHLSTYGSAHAEHKKNCLPRDRRQTQRLGCEDRIVFRIPIPVLLPP